MAAPLQPEHADTVKPITGAPRFSIRRVLVGYAYPQNGNIHNPTPQYRWHLLLDEHLVDHSDRRTDLVEAARQPGAVGVYLDN